jgi:hypothetical protein
LLTLKCTTRYVYVNVYSRRYANRTDHGAWRGPAVRTRTALEFYAEVSRATERMPFPCPAGTIAHAEIEIGDAVVVIMEEDDRQRATNAPRASTAVAWRLTSENIRRRRWYSKPRPRDYESPPPLILWSTSGGRSHAGDPSGRLLPL